MAECQNKVPWLDGPPTDIFYLDDDGELRRADITLNITLNNNLKRSDYYLHWNNRTWALVERKNGPSRIDIAIEQLKSTIRQLRAQGRRIDRLIVVAEKLSPNAVSVADKAISGEHQDRRKEQVDNGDTECKPAIQLIFMWNAEKRRCNYCSDTIGVLCPYCSCSIVFCS
jgi:hypothetical protein